MNSKCIEKLVKDLTWIRKQVQALDGCDIAGIESNLEAILMLVDQSLYGLGADVDLETDLKDGLGDSSAQPQEK